MSRLAAGSSVDARAELERRIHGYRASQCIYVAAELRLADHLAAGERSAADLAALCGADAGALARLLRALAAIGIVAPREAGRWALAPAGEALRTEVPGSLLAEALHALAPTAWRPWGRLLESVRTGCAAFPDEFGCSAWEYRAAHPEARDRFDAMAAARAESEAEAVVALLTVPERGVVVDVGGGDGELLARLLARHPTLAGVLLERPAVVAEARRRLEREGLAGRCRLEGGDFFGEVPAGGDLYLLKAVLHNWDDGAAARLLAVCRRAMSPGSRLVVIEALVDAPPRPEELQDLHMLVVHGGRERDSAELVRLLAESGFRAAAPRATGVGPCLVEASPV